MNIPAGYWLRIMTWENDGDNYQTQDIYGLTDSDVLFYIDLASKFTSRNDNDNPGLGNSFVPIQSIIKAVKDSLKKFPGISEDHKDFWKSSFSNQDEDECLLEHLYEFILGFPGEGYYSENPNFCRVFDRVEVFRIPNEIEDVTKRFYV